MNLPNNPFDLEQRQGRVHRYKGHAIRLNVADKHAAFVRGCGTFPADPWSAMFSAAKNASGVTTGLIPYWIYDGPIKLECRAPLQRYSKEVIRLK